MDDFLMLFCCNRFSKLHMVAYGFVPLKRVMNCYDVCTFVYTYVYTKRWSKLLCEVVESCLCVNDSGQCGYHGLPARDGLTESCLKDLLHGSEYVLTYEDKDGDWMLVGDVPWE